MSDGKDIPDQKLPGLLLEIGQIRSISLTLLGRVLRSFNLRDDLGNVTIRKEPLPLLRLLNEEEEAEKLRRIVNKIREERPLEAKLALENVNRLIQEILDVADMKGALAKLDQVEGLAQKLLKAALPQDASQFSTSIRNKFLEVSAKHLPKGVIAEALEIELEQQRFVAAVMEMCASLREAGRKTFTRDEEIALEHAYRLLDEGIRLPRVYQSICHSDDRPVQTYVSFADAGDGHLMETVRDKALLDGLIVHIEYIDRDGIADKEYVEAYRLPAIRNAARIGLHIGTSAPYTAFIGRPVFEAGYKFGFLKAAHTLASVCSAMFSQGVADCKIAMDGMTASQCIEFMRVVAGNVVRDPMRQRLSAAFNLNTDLQDDISTSVARKLEGGKHQFRIADLAIRLVELGRFDKVAWDGASTLGQGQSILLGQLSRVELFRLVHKAHEKGLETYISASMSPEHLRDATYVGVGAVGIGTSLHHLSEDDIIGEVNTKKLLQTLEVRREASGQTPAIVARNVAMLDWAFHNGNLSKEENRHRHEIAKALEAYLAKLDSISPKAPWPSEERAGKVELSAEYQSLFDQAKQAWLETAQGVTKQHNNEIPFLPSPNDATSHLALGSGRSLLQALALDPSEIWAEKILSLNDRSAQNDYLSRESSEILRRRLKSRDLSALRKLMI